MRATVLAVLMVLSSSIAAQDTHWPAYHTTSEGTLCRVTAQYAVAFLTGFLPTIRANGREMPAVMSASIRLRPGCPRDGVARVAFVHAGQRFPEDGYALLDAEHPQFYLRAIPGYYQGVWHSLGGTDYILPWQTGP